MQILGHLGQGVGEGEFFENSQICKIELEDQNGGTAEGKPLLDIDMVLAPYCPQMVRNWRGKVYFSIYCPKSPGGAPKVDQTFFCDFGRFSDFEFTPLGGRHPLSGHCALYAWGP